MNNLEKAKEIEKTMTTKELAEVLGVSTRTIQLTVEKLSLTNVLSQVKIRGQNAFVFNEEQATLIKQEIQKHHNLQSRQIDTVNTDLEVLANAANALLQLQDLYKRKEAEYKAQIEEQTKQLVEQKPKVDFYNAVTGSNDTHEMKEVAKLLNFKNIGRNRLFEILREQKVLDRNNQPYQKYVDCGYFRIIESKWTDNSGDTHINFKTVVFQKGVEFIKDIVSKVS